MSNPIKTPSNTDPAPLAGPHPIPSRRRLLQGGLAAAPVLMTLVSRPVLAQSCTTPSGYVSANASTAGRGVACTGRTPTFWKSSESFNSWVGYFPTTLDGPGGHKATYFDAAFKTSTPHYPKKTLLDVLGTTGGPPDEVARYLVAALLNVAKGWAPTLTPQVVQHMANEYLGNGTFSPSSGASWNAAELIDYLRTTMPL